MTSPELVRDNLYAMWKDYDLWEEQYLGQSKTRAERHQRDLKPQDRRLCETESVGTARDSKLTVRLTNEHRTISGDLGRLMTEAGKLEADPLSSESMLFTQLAESLNEHFRREEQLLFPILGRSLGPDICNRLSNEHAQIINIAEKLSDQTRPLTESLTHMEKLFLTHISTEENVLFWYLDLHEINSMKVSSNAC